MENDWSILIVPLCFVGQLACFVILLVGIVAAAYNTRRARARAWEEVGRLTGLAFEPGNFFTTPRLSGTYRGHTLTLDTFRRGSGKNSTTITRIVIFVDNRSEVYLALYEEGLFSKIGKFFGAEDVQVGDEEIDRRFVIKSRPENFAARLATSISLRARLLEARSINIEVDGRELYFEQVQPLTDPEYARTLFDLLSDLAGFVERA